MNKKILFLTISILSIFFGYYTFDRIHAQEKKFGLYDKNKEVTQPIKKLLELTNTTVDNYNLSTVVTATQKNWLRKDGSERWDIVDIYNNKKDDFFALFNQLNLIEEIAPSCKEYNYLLLMGAATQTIEKRLKTVIDLSANEIQWKNLVFLSGKRPLTEKEMTFLKEKYNCNENCPTTETEMMLYLYHHPTSSSSILHNKNFKTIIVDVPMKIDAQGITRRPTTADTVELWIDQENPTPGSCLVISNQPYIIYQDSIAKSLLPKDFTIETIGSLSEEKNIGVYLDTIARILYSEEKRLNKK